MRHHHLDIDGTLGIRPYVIDVYLERLTFLATDLLYDALGLPALVAARFFRLVAAFCAGVNDLRTFLGRYRPRFDLGFFSSPLLT
jgi:hypothetical protein